MKKICVLMLLFFFYAIGFIFAQGIKGRQEVDAGADVALGDKELMRQLDALNSSLQKLVGQDNPATLPAEAEMQWVWGEIVLLYPREKNMLIRYIDYETDTEKEVIINVDERTSYEGINSFFQLKEQDTVSVDYVIDNSDRALAQMVSVERMSELLDDNGSKVR
ncbi:MAG: hypothetical protein ABIG46_05620 [Candidatus Omnitrophota bacterium]